MSVPTSKQTLANYFKSSLLNKALNMSGKKFLLVHGSADGKFYKSVAGKLIYESNRQIMSM